MIWKFPEDTVEALLDSLLRKDQGNNVRILLQIGHQRNGLKMSETSEKTWLFTLEWILYFNKIKAVL